MTKADDSKESKNKKRTTKKTESKKSVESGKIKKIKKEVDKLKNELAEANDKYIRMAAEFNNFKKRSERDFANLIESANRNLFMELLPTIDDFERSLNSENTDKTKKSYKSLKDGIDLIYHKLISTLKKQGLEAIETVDTPFDPEFHEALMQIENKDKDSNIILEEIQKGYLMKNKVIRHSRVVVNK
jgi:molecular chaperone GrpE